MLALGYTKHGFVTSILEGTSMCPPGWLTFRTLSIVIWQRVGSPYLQGLVLSLLPTLMNNNCFVVVKPPWRFNDNFLCLSGQVYHFFFVVTVAIRSTISSTAGLLYLMRLPASRRNRCETILTNIRMKLRIPVHIKLKIPGICRSIITPIQPVLA